MKSTISPAVAAQFEEYCPTPDDSRSAERPVPCRLLKPAALIPGERYRLVVYLHGAGERGDDNRAQLKYLPEWMASTEYRHRYPCFLLAPQCPHDAWWIDVDWSGRRPRMTREMGSRLSAVVAAADRLLVEYAVDRDRQYLTGISMGGFAAWDLGIRFPDRFAAVVPICGGGDPSQVAALANTPVWCFHGERDTIVPPEHSREMIEALRAAGGEPLYSELEGVGHDSWTPAYRNSKCLEWMFQQRRTA